MGDQRNSYLPQPRTNPCIAQLHCSNWSWICWGSGRGPCKVGKVEAFYSMFTWQGVNMNNMWTIFIKIFIKIFNMNVYECDIAVTYVNFLEKIVPGLCQVAQLQRSQSTADAALGVLWALPGVGPSSCKLCKQREWWHGAYHWTPNSAVHGALATEMHLCVAVWRWIHKTCVSYAYVRAQENPEHLALLVFAPPVACATAVGRPVKIQFAKRKNMENLRLQVSPWFQFVATRRFVKHIKHKAAYNNSLKPVDAKRWCQARAVAEIIQAPRKQQLLAKIGFSTDLVPVPKQALCWSAQYFLKSAPCCQIICGLFSPSCLTFSLPCCRALRPPSHRLSPSCLHSCLLAVGCCWVLCPLLADRLPLHPPSCPPSCFLSCLILLPKDSEVLHAF